MPDTTTLSYLSTPISSNTMTTSAPSILSTLSIPLASIAGTHLDPTWFSNFSYDTTERIREQHECLVQQEKFEYVTGLAPVDSNGGGTLYYGVDNANPVFDFSLIAGRTLADVATGIDVLTGKVSIDIELMIDELSDGMTNEEYEAFGGYEALEKLLTKSTWTITADGTLVRV